MTKLDPATLTLEQCRYYHRQLWDWLATPENARRPKSSWPGWAQFTRRAEVCCFACEYASRMHRKPLGMCSYCPILWPERTCSLPNRLYAKWGCSESANESTTLAAQIRDLPWKGIDDTESEVEKS